MLPFTHNDFFEVFADYSRATPHVQAAAYLLGAAILWAAMTPSSRARLIAFVGLALLWAWTGLVYHLVFLARINPIAPLFAVGFVMQAGLFGVAAFMPAPRVQSPTSRVRLASGWIAIVYATVAYPAAFLLQGKAYPALPASGSRPAR
jgi:hypothetical protein